MFKYYTNSCSNWWKIFFSYFHYKFYTAKIHDSTFATLYNHLIVFTFFLLGTHHITISNTLDDMNKHCSSNCLNSEGIEIKKFNTKKKIQIFLLVYFSSHLLSNIHQQHKQNKQYKNKYKYKLDMPINNPIITWILNI